MPNRRFLSIAEQVAEYLRGEVARGRWGETLPGVRGLAAELIVNMKTVNAALQQLEREGILEKGGTGQQRRIVQSENSSPQCLRVGILPYEKDDSKLDFFLDLVSKLQEQGYQAVPAARSLIDLGMDERRVARFVARNPADAWVIIAGSRDVLEWFSRQPVPAFALLGRQPSVSIAGTAPRKSSAMAATARRLTELGHRRIVLLTREERRKPEPGIVERAFLGELEAQGIKTGAYNLPDWEDNSEGFLDCLSSLFRITPPTALIAGGPELFAATQQFLLHHGIRVPQDVSIVSGDPHPSFAWCHPSISHIDYDNSIWVRNTMRWINKVAQGKDDRRQVISKAKFVEGGTIGPVSEGLSA